jgi:AcrR family transcriptional regulator
LSEIASVRRSSYGPSSPTIGERGARTRQAILDASLALFAQKGFHATLIDDIATRVGISRAALYQYFASKEEIFIELAHTAGNDLIRVVRRLGPLGPTAQGFDNLHWWIEWRGSRTSTPRCSWNGEGRFAGGRRCSHISDFAHSYAVRMTQRLTQADLNGLAPEGTALAILAMMRRVNQYRAMGTARGLPDEAVLDTLAITVQLALFPDTPADVLALADAGETTRRKARTQHDRSPDAVVHFESLEDRFNGRSERAMSTIRRLLDAGGQVVAERGFHATSVEDILKRASLGRGTFYKYFDDKLDLLQVQAAGAGAPSLGDRFVNRWWIGIRHRCGHGSDFVAAVFMPASSEPGAMANH